MNTIREVLKINEAELAQGIAGTAASWHSKYAQSAWVYAGNLDHALTEGDVICVLSQFGEIEDLHLVRDETTGQSRGFAFAKYEDARSAVLAVDNLCGISLCGRSLRVDHVENYRLPKRIMTTTEQQDTTSGPGDENRTRTMTTSAATTTTVEALVQHPGQVYKGLELDNGYTLDHGQDLFAPTTVQKKEQRPPSSTEKKDNADDDDDDDQSRQQRIRREKKRRNKKEGKDRQYEGRGRKSNSDDYSKERLLDNEEVEEQRRRKRHKSRREDPQSPRDDVSL